VPERMLRDRTRPLRCSQCRTVFPMPALPAPAPEPEPMAWRAPEPPPLRVVEEPPPAPEGPSSQVKLPSPSAKETSRKAACPG
jgi:hypothetical protein